MFMHIQVRPTWFCECSHAQTGHSLFDDDYNMYPCLVAGCKCTDYTDCDDYSEMDDGLRS